MPKSTKATSDAASEWSCGPLKPQQADQEIPAGTPAPEILAKITLLCNDSAGVFLFQYDQKLYLRIIGQE